ncbi:MAG: hypothetical protein HOP11_00910 [Saprospiraceae bacterium]|nr:hypothetical protein [Saprospiraceae bacterium]
MKKQSFRILISSIILLLFNSLNAQTPTEDLQIGIKEYGVLAEMLEGFNRNKFTTTEIDNFRIRFNNGILLLEKVVLKGNSNQIKVARFYQSLFRFKTFMFHYYLNEKAKSYELIKPLESELTSRVRDDFPLIYSYFGEEYTVQWENFSQTQIQFYVAAGLVSYAEGQYIEAYRLSKKAIDYPSISNILKYFALNTILDCENKGSVSFSPTERLDYASRSLISYQNLSESERGKLGEKNYETLRRGINILLEIVEKDVSAPVIKACANGAKIGGTFIKKGDLSILMLYTRCYISEYSGNIDYHKEALAYARGGFNEDVGNKVAAQYVGIRALDALVRMNPATNCSDLIKYAAEYRYFEKTTKAEELELLIPKCEQKRIEEEKAEARRARRANRYFSVYMGFEPFPAFASSGKVDIGGHIDLRGRRVAHSFGFANIKQKKDLISAKERWDGIKTFYALKIFNKTQIAYTGLYLGYANKEFTPINALIIPNDKSIPTYSSLLSPIDKQYEILWNSGMQILGKFLGGDVWFGVGGAYHQLSYDEKVVIKDNEISGHEFFEKRKSANQFTIIMRLGLSIGLNIGDSRMK